MVFVFYIFFTPIPLTPITHKKTKYNTKWYLNKFIFTTPYIHILLTNITYSSTTYQYITQETKCIVNFLEEKTQDTRVYIYTKIKSKGAERII